MMSKRLLAGLGAGFGVALAVSVVGATDASACSRWNRGCGSYYAPPVVSQYGPPPAYGYVPPAPVYGWGPPPWAYYAPRPRGYYGTSYGFYGDTGYGYRSGRRCGRGYGYWPRRVW
jgi:hypothetical protein